MTCRTYFCPTHRRVGKNFLQVLCNYADNWYEYGLVVSESALLELFYKQIIDRAGISETDPIFDSSADFKQHWKTLVTLKVRWPYRAANRPLANYFFNDPIYAKPDIDYRNTEKTGSRYDDVFRELNSRFESEKDLLDAENQLESLLDGLAAIVTK